MNDILNVLKERREILEKICSSQKAYWLMIENNNLEQIKEMLISLNLMMEKLGKFDNILKKASFQKDDTVSKEIDTQTSRIEEILAQDRKIYENLSKKKSEISVSLMKNKKDITLTNTYSKNIPRKDFQKFNKKI